MKIIFTLLLSSFFFFNVIAQSSKRNSGDYEVKVISYNYKTIKGLLKKVNVEGIGVEDYKGNYFIFRPAEITKIKIKKRGLTFGEAVGGGTLMGLGLGAAIWSLDENGESTGDMAKLTAALTVTGAVVGSAVGGIAELSNKKLTLRVKGNANYFKKNYSQLDKYVSGAPETIHVANN